jgi:hypothetical protein
MSTREANCNILKSASTAGETAEASDGISVCVGHHNSTLKHKTKIKNAFRNRH